MTKRTKEEFLNDFSELKANMKIAKKMFRDSYDEEVTQLKEMEKVFKIGLKIKDPITESDLSLAILLVNQRLQRMNNTQHMLNHLMLGNLEKSLETVLMVNGIIDIIGDLARDSQLKSVQTKVTKLQKFQNHIIKSVKQQQKLKPTSTQAYAGVK